MVSELGRSLIFSILFAANTILNIDRVMDSAIPPIIWVGIWRFMGAKP